MPTVEIFSIASTLVAVAIFLYLRFGIRNYLKQVVHSEFHALLEEVTQLREAGFSDGQDDSK